MNSVSPRHRILGRRWVPAALTFSLVSILTWVGCVDRTPTGVGSLRALVSLRAVVSGDVAEFASELDMWQVDVFRLGEEPIGHAEGSVGPGQETVSVPAIEVLLNSECEQLRVRIELYSGGILWWSAERGHQVCAEGDNGIEVPGSAFAWVGPVRPVVSPLALYFGSVGRGKEVSLSFQIRNGGSGGLSWSARLEGQSTGWLRVDPASGTVPGGSSQEVSVVVDARNLALGTYAAAVVVDGNQVPSERVEVTAEVVEGPKIGLSPTELRFETDQGTSPAVQTFTVSHQGQVDRLNWSASSDQGWLSVSPSSGGLDAGAGETVSVSVESSGLGDGTYDGTITVAAAGAVNTPQSLQVVLTVREVYNSSISGRVVAGGVGLEGVTVQLDGPGGPKQDMTGSEGAYGFAELADGSYTVSISGYPSAVTFEKTSETVSVGVNESRTVDFQGIWRYTLAVSKTGEGTVISSPSGISIGTSGASDTGVFDAGTTVTLTAAPATGWRVGDWGGTCSNLPTGSTECIVGMDGDKTVSVAFEEIPPNPVLVRNPASMTFRAVEGGPDPVDQTLEISNGGGGTLSWRLTDNANWLSAAPASGTTTVETDQVAVSVNLGELEAGTYTAAIIVTGAAPATGSPQTTSVTLIVDPPAPVLVRQPAEMVFYAVVGGSNPPDQPLAIWNGGGGFLDWSVSEGVPWLSLSPTSGVSSEETDKVTVSVDISDLAVGNYNTEITLSAEAPAVGSPQTTWVALIVEPGLSISGKVYYDTSPLAGVTVDLGRGATWPPSWERSTQSAADGSYAFPNLSPDNYYIRMNGLGGEFISGSNSYPIEVTEFDVVRDLYMPKVLNLLSPADGSIDVSQNPTLLWSENPDAARYAVNVYQVNPWQNVYSTWVIDGTSHTVEASLTQGEEYSWYVDAVNSQWNQVGDSPWWNFTVAEATEVPAEPSNLVTNVRWFSDNWTEMTWTDNSNNEEGFSIERCTGVGGCTELSEVAKVGPNETRYEEYVPVIQCNYYRVRAFNGVGYSGYSNVSFVCGELPF